MLQRKYLHNIFLEHWKINKKNVGCCNDKGINLWAAILIFVIYFLNIFPWHYNINLFKKSFLLLSKEEINCFNGWTRLTNSIQGNAIGTLPQGHQICIIKDYIPGQKYNAQYKKRNWLPSRNYFLWK